MRPDGARRTSEGIEQEGAELPPLGFNRAVFAAAAPLIMASSPIFLTGALGVRLREELGISETELGLAVGMVPATGAIVAIWMGKAVQRVGAAVALRAGVAVAAAGMFATAWFTTGYGMLLVSLIIGGLGVAIVFPATDYWISRTVSPTRQGLAVGIKQASPLMAGLFAGLAVPGLAVTLGWRWAYAGGAALAALSVFTVPRRVSLDGSIARSESGSDVPWKMMAIVAGAMALGQMSVFSLVGFSVSAAVEAGISESISGVVFAGGNLLGIMTRLRLGHLADLQATRNQLHVAAGLLVCGAACYMLLATASRPVLLVTIPLAFATGWGWPGIVMLAVIRANPNAPAVASSIAAGGANTGAFIGPFVFGALAAGSFATAWAVAAASALVAAGGMLLAGRVICRPARIGG